MMKKHYAAEQTTPSAPARRSKKEARFHAHFAMAGVIGLALSNPILYAGNVLINGYVDVAEKAAGPLPPAVAAQVSHAVHLQIEERNQLSGISLGNGFFLSAGHGLLRRGEQPSAESVDCAKVTISGLYEGRPYKVPAAGKVAENPDERHDIAMYKVDEHSEYGVTRAPGKKLPAGPRIAAEPLHVGDPVYFVNWEPTADNRDRDPHAGPGLNTPAIFSGVVIKAGDTPQVVTDIQSFGAGVPDQIGRAGMSGGEVLNKYGELTGLSNRAPDQTWGAHLLNLQIGPFGLPGNGHNITQITPVTSAEIAALEVQAQQAPVC